MKNVFRKAVLATVNNNVGGYAMNTFLTTGDLNNDGRPDLIVSGWDGRMVWLENRGERAWIEHVIDPAVKDVECGGSLIDLTGNGYLDVICGSASGGAVWWWENPGAGDRPWPKHTILQPGSGYFHDTATGRISPNDPLHLFLNHQDPPNGATVYSIPIPADPTCSPWPGAQVIASQQSEALVGPDGSVLKHQAEEGLAIGDIDGDGQNEIVSGTSWFKYQNAAWHRYKFAQGYITNKAVIGDVDGDGKNEIVLSEGDPMIYGKTQGGRLGWFKPGADITELWAEHILDDGLLDAHSLVLGDVCRQGRLDILTAEIGWADENRGYKRRAPWVLLFENLGSGRFARHIIDQGTGAHEGVLADLRGSGRLDFVCKPLHGPDRWNIVALLNDQIILPDFAI
ncbi:MAG: VCBS repeat-containing protein, partial [Chloroflexi bacterium]